MMRVLTLEIIVDDDDVERAIDTIDEMLTDADWSWSWGESYDHDNDGDA